MRARGSDGRIEERLGRAIDEALAKPDVIIVNVGDAADHARRLVDVIKDEGAR
jgi:ribose 1,5-bisphosphokinase